MACVPHSGRTTACAVFRETNGLHIFSENNNFRLCLQKSENSEKYPFPKNTSSTVVMNPADVNNFLTLFSYHKTYLKKRIDLFKKSSQRKHIKCLQTLTKQSF